MLFLLGEGGCEFARRVWGSSAVRGFGYMKYAGKGSCSAWKLMSGASGGLGFGVP